MLTNVTVLTALVVMVLVAVGCTNPTHTPATAAAPSPLWSEEEAIAVVKEQCANSQCQREISLLQDLEWTARYESRDRRWDVRVSGLRLFGRDKLVYPVRAYVYENTRTVEWFFDK